MTAHMCRTVTDGCYRCELGRDEAEAAQMDDLREAAADAMHNSFNGANEWEDALADLFRETLTALAPDRRSLSHNSPWTQAVFALAQRYLEQEGATHATTTATPATAHDERTADE